VLTVFVPVLAAVLGLILVQRVVPPTHRAEHNDVAGFIYAVVGVAYAVLLAFVVIVVWQDYERAKETVESEANELAGVYLLADRFPGSSGERVQELARSYAKTVVEEEWPLMEEGESSERARSCASSGSACRTSMPARARVRCSTTRGSRGCTR
jgi:hypothetical protein